MDIRAIAMGLSFALIWSSAFTSGRMIVEDAPPLTALALRFLFSGIVAVGIALAAGQSWRLDRREWRTVIVFGICQNALYLGLMFFAMTRIEASLAAIVASTMPLIVALLGWLWHRERMSALGLAGLMAGTLGAILLMGGRVGGGADLIGVLCAVVAALALAVATLSVRALSPAPAAAGETASPVKASGRVMMVVGMQMFVGAAALGLVAPAVETWEVNWTPRLVLAFLYTSLVSGVLVTWIWFRLVARIGAVKAATFHFLNPFFGVAIAALLLGERFGAIDLLGVAIIAAGILAVQLSKAR